ncbi:hypothetical protein JCM10212_001001 [Sporobolomyces blumeae]
MSSPDPTLLLQELLSPATASTDLRQTLQLVTYHLSTIPLASPHLRLVGLITRYSLTSPSLWTASNPGVLGDGTEQSQWTSRTAVYGAFFQATLLRLDAVSRETGTGYRGRRSVSSFLTALSDGAWADPVRTRAHDPEPWGTVEPVHRVLVLGAVLAALQEWKRRKEKLWVGGRGMMDRIEGDFGKAWFEWTQHGDPQDRLAAWVAAQSVPSVSTPALAKDFPVAALLRYVTDSLSAVFVGGRLFSEPPLSDDLIETDDGLSWSKPSPSHDQLVSVTTSPLFASLGPLSRAIGRLLSANALLATSYDPAIVESALSSIRHLSQTLLDVTSSLAAGWVQTRWSDLVDESSLSPPTRTETQPWTILKSLLFAQTLIYSSLLEILSSASSGNDLEPTTAQRELARQAVVTLGRTYFVASRFGQGGFKAWRAVLAGLVDVAAAPTLENADSSSMTPAERLVRDMEPPEGDDAGGKHRRSVHRAEGTFWMNTIEQVMEDLSDGYVEGTVLPRCRPYLDDPIYPEPFESAHSVVLAAFSTNKAVVPQIAPWYTTLLLDADRKLMAPHQLRIAFATMVSSVSHTDDALAWWCIRELVAAIERLPTSTVAQSDLDVSSVSPLTLRKLDDDDVDSGNDDPSLPASDPGTDVDSVVAPPTLEGRALALARGSLLLTLISLLPSVNLVLFRSLLAQVARLVTREPAASDGRAALGAWTFEVLGAGMDVVKREEGVRWWLENRDTLLGSRERAKEAEEKVAKVEARIKAQL